MPHPIPSPIGLLALALLLGTPAGLSAQAGQAAQPSGGTASGDLATGFQNPPDSAKPRTWWHWVSGNVSREGITADLEAMKSIGLAGAQIFTVDQSDVKGPVVFMSPEWRQLVHHALSEGNRLGLEMAMENGEGWSESGGPWVTPAQSMQKVVWAEQDITGGRSVTLALPQPPALRGYYEDIALFAFPQIPGDPTVAPRRITTPAGEAGTVISVAGASVEKPQWVLLDFAQPMPFRSLQIATAQPIPTIVNPPHWELQVSDDGRSFRRVCDAPQHGMVTFPEVTGRYYRLWIPVMPPKTPVLAFSRILLAGARLDRAEAQTGMAVDRSLPDFSPTAFPAANVIPAGSVVDLTRRAVWDAPPGNWTLVRLGHTSTGVTNHPAAPATVGLECDKLSAAAVSAHFQKGMLGTVIADNGPLIGSSLRYVLCDSWEAGCENWTPLMREDFIRRRGYDPQPWLLALTGRVVGSQEMTERFLWDFRRTLADLVAENHYGTLQRLAHEHHMGLYAEAAGIGMPTVADQLQCKGFTDVPMGEFWVDLTATSMTPIDDTKEAASAAHIYGQNIAGAEAFTSQAEFAGWSRDPYSLKALGDLEFCLGINRFVFHRYAHQPWLDRQPGMSMGPWGTNFERTNTWWTSASAWMSYLSRCQYLLQQGNFAADLCYYYGEGAPVDVETEQLTPKLPLGFDCDFCNTEILRRMTVQNGRVILPSGMKYRVLVLPDTDRMTVPVLEKIRDLVQAGATVLGPRPTRTPSLAGYPACDATLQSIAGEVWGDCDGQTVTEHRYGQGRVFWGRPLPEVLGIAPDFTSEDGDLHFIHRHDDAAEIYFVSNQRTREAVVSCTFRVAGKIPELWHPDTGRMETAACYTSKDGRTTLPLHFDPAGSVFVIFRKSAAADDPIVAISESAQVYPSVEADAAAPLAAGPVTQDGHVIYTAWRSGTYRFLTASGLTLLAPAVAVPHPVRLEGAWTLVFPPRLEAPPQITLERLVSWADYNADHGVKYFSGTATYRKDFNLPAELFGPGLRQFLDLGEVKNLARVELNGHALGILWKEPFRVEITGCARPGINHLAVQVTNLWPNRMIGDLSVLPSQRVTWASIAPYTKISPLLPSGLLGPVLIRAAREVEPVVSSR